MLEDIMNQLSDYSAEQGCELDESLLEEWPDDLWDE